MCVKTTRDDTELSRRLCDTVDAILDGRLLTEEADEGIDDAGDGVADGAPDVADGDRVPPTIDEEASEG